MNDKERDATIGKLADQMTLRLLENMLQQIDVEGVYPEPKEWAVLMNSISRRYRDDRSQSQGDTIEQIMSRQRDVLARIDNREMPDLDTSEEDAATRGLGA